MKNRFPHSGPEVIKIFMLKSTEHEIFHAHKCLNANNCWHFNSFRRKNSIVGLSESRKENPQKPTEPGKC